MADITITEVIHNAIKKHAGLSDWDDEAIEEEVEAIIQAIKNEGFAIVDRRDEPWDPR